MFNIKNIIQSTKKLWFTEFKIKNKKFNYGNIVASLLIIATISTAINYFGGIALLLIWAKSFTSFMVKVIAQITFKALIFAGIKRFFIDTLITSVLKKHVFNHITPAIISRIKYHKSLFIRFVTMLIAAIGAAFATIISFFAQGFALIKTFSFFIIEKIAITLGLKSVWAVIINIYIWLKTTTIGTLIQVYILSYFIEFLTKYIPKNVRKKTKPVLMYPLKKFWQLQGLIDKIFGTHLQENIIKIAKWLDPIKRKSFSEVYNDLKNKKQNKRYELKENQKRKIKNQNKVYNNKLKNQKRKFY